MTTYGSLFSGIGGIDLGLDRAGMRAEWLCEKDEACQRVLRRHKPFTPIYDDVTKLKGDSVARVDVLCGGFPCQDLSVAGGRAGLAGERSGLFFEFMRVAAELAPRWVLIENVPGLLSSNGGRDMGAVVGTLADLGYGWCYRVLDAQYFGVAQRRRRVFIVGCAGDPRRAAQVLLEPSCCDGDSPPRREAREEVAGMLGGGSGERGWAPDTDRMTFIPELAHRVSAGQHTSANDPDRVTLIPALTTRCGNVQDDQQTGQLVQAFMWQAGGRKDPCGAFIQDDLSPTMPTSQTVAVAYPLANQRATPYARQMTTGGRKPGQGYPAVRDGMAVRRLMPLECERLQGFPDGWTEGEADSARYRMLGNAVCVNVSHWIGRRIVEAS